MDLQAEIEAIAERLAAAAVRIGEALAAAEKRAEEAVAATAAPDLSPLDDAVSKVEALVPSTTTTTATDASGSTTGSASTTTDASGSDHSTTASSTTAASTAIDATAPSATADATVPATTAPAPTLPLYVVQPGVPVDATVWTKTDLTTPAGQPLYTFRGDVAGGFATGGSAFWTHYTGPTVSASS